MKKVFAIACICILTSFKLKAQADTFAFLQSATVTIQANANTTGIAKFDLQLKNENTLADAIQKQSAIFVKQYGLGGLSTVSMRGLGAQHTAVMWNGLNLQSCMNSIMDFNLLPTFFLDNATIETGANASTCGNGTLAGAIYMNNKNIAQKRIFGEFQAGSFNQKQIALGAAYGEKKLKFQTRILYRNGLNNFEFENIFLPNKPIQRQENNAFEQKGILQEIQYISAKKHSLFAKIWLMETNRQLPPPMGVVNNAKEKQYDQSTRYTLLHLFAINKKVFNTNKIAYFTEELNYYNAYYPTAYSKAKTMIVESDLKLSTTKNSFLYFQINNTYTTAKTDGYTNGPKRNLLSLLAKYHWQYKERLKLSAAARLQLVNDTIAPLAPDFGLDYTLLKWLKIKANVAASYRVPSFNDFYWNVGGNKNLKPERGYKQELTFETKYKNLKSGITVFANQVNNWILWQPSATSSIWTATNAKQVHSNGIEISSEYGIKLKAHSFKINGRYQYVESKNTKVSEQQISALNKQLMYVPFHTAFSQFSYHYSHWLLEIGGQYTGERYTTSDNSKTYQLPAYTLINAGVGYRFKFKFIESMLYFKANNVLKTNYQIMENRPMPLSNYQLTLKFNIE